MGSEFIVTLPMGQEIYETHENTEFILNDGASTETDNEIDEVSQDMPMDTDKVDPISILIVEDNMELRSFLHTILSENYKVIEAINGQEGLERAQEHVPDLIISDIMMPVMDGLDMVKNIKENREICHIPIILLSAKSSLDDRISGLEQGIDDYITKPFSATYLKARCYTSASSYRIFSGNNGLKNRKVPLHHLLTYPHHSRKSLHSMNNSCSK